MNHRHFPKSKETIKKISEGVRKTREKDPSYETRRAQTWMKNFQENPETRRKMSEGHIKYSIGDEKIFNGYVNIYEGIDQWVPKHRKIMEKILGRKLLQTEHIHHIDKNPLNNSLENLKIVSNSEHTRIHHKGKIRSEESNRKQSETRKRLYAEGKLDRNCNRMHTKKAVDKMAATMKDRYASGVKMGWQLIHERGYHHSQETKDKISKAVIKRYHG